MKKKHVILILIAGGLLGSLVTFLCMPEPSNLSRHQVGLKAQLDFLHDIFVATQEVAKKQEIVIDIIEKDQKLVDPRPLRGTDALGSALLLYGDLTDRLAEIRAEHDKVKEEYLSTFRK